LVQLSTNPATTPSTEPILRPGSTISLRKTPAKRESRKKDYTEDSLLNFAELEYQTRLTYQVWFRIKDKDRIQMIENIWGDSLKLNSFEWKQSVKKIDRNTANWKHRAVLNMKVRKASHHHNIYWFLMFTIGARQELTPV